MFNNWYNRKKSKTSDKVHSSYWLRGWANDSILVGSMSQLERESHDIYKLAAAKRAISNFVNIVTSLPIKVEFNEKDKSYTDGKSVVIGTKILEPKDFDVAVGLSCHEGTHIKLSDFDIIKDLDNLIPDKINKSAIAKGFTKPVAILHSLLNYIEDRRIDQHTFDSAPGYRNYYRAMYDKYFNSKIVDIGLLSNEARTETWRSYEFRIINFHNRNTDLDSLKALREIYELIDLNNINRLKTTKDSLDIAIKVFELILKVVEQATEEDNREQGDGESGDGGSDGSESDLTDEEFQDLLDSIGKNNGNGNGKPQMGRGNGRGKLIKLSDKQRKLLEKKIQEQRDFLKGNVKKEEISQAQNNNVQQIEKSGSELKTVGQDTDEGFGVVSGVQCIVVKKLSQSLLESDLFPLTNRDNYGSSSTVRRYYDDEVATGIKLGNILGKKLQVRGESRTTIYNRQKVGKIDKRMIASLGFGNENVFTYNDIDQYNKANLHISIDASGSMDGTKWRETITNITAMCKAVDMISNLEIQISIRTTSQNIPYLIMAYDSRVDKFSKVKKMFPCFDPNGTTPEGLCYEAIMRDFLSSSNTVDSYFINISDGDPYYHGDDFYYSGTNAYEHTRKMFKKIQDMGIKTLSYFVSDYSGRALSDGFKRMYGKSAKAIDVTSISQITKTINEMFLDKSKRE